MSKHGGESRNFNVQFNRDDVHSYVYINAYSLEVAHMNPKLPSVRENVQLLKEQHYRMRSIQVSSELILLQWKLPKLFLLELLQKCLRWYYIETTIESNRSLLRHSFAQSSYLCSGLPCISTCHSLLGPVLFTIQSHSLSLLAKVLFLRLVQATCFIGQNIHWNNPRSYASCLIRCSPEDGPYSKSTQLICSLKLPPIFSAFITDAHTCAAYKRTELTTCDKDNVMTTLKSANLTLTPRLDTGNRTDPCHRYIMPATVHPNRKVTSAFSVYPLLEVVVCDAMSASLIQFHPAELNVHLRSRVTCVQYCPSLKAFLANSKNALVASTADQPFQKSNCLFDRYPLENLVHCIQKTDPIGLPGTKGQYKFF